MLLSEVTLPLWFITWWAYLCLIATYVLRVLPTPDEIPGKWYIIIYNIIRRFAGNRGWKP